jgi:hypothetical protein
MKKLVLALLLATAACKSLQGGDVELCYTHPKYGVVCVKINGKNYRIDRPDLTLEERDEVEAWLRAQLR